MLLEQYARFCTILVKEQIASDEGGFATVWTDGDNFTAYIALNSSAATTRGEKEGYLATFNVLVDKDTDIKYGDYFRDEGGGVFLVMTEPAMSQSPGTATFSLKNFTAQREDAP